MSAATQAQACDVFNGDADGICALHQLRLAAPKSAQLITGVKRDVALLDRVPCVAGIDVTVLDISLDTNADALKRLLHAGAHVTYFDHHAADQRFAHGRLDAHIDTSPQVCTSLLVDRHLRGRYRPWAIAAAFGDNLAGVARAMAEDQGFSAAHIQALQELGEVLNYNAYGEHVADLHIAPAELYRAVHKFVDPWDFAAVSPVYQTLLEGYRADTARLEGLQPCSTSHNAAVYLLDASAWSRRISGLLANRLASLEPGRSFAVLTPKQSGGYLASVRSGNPSSLAAHEFCRQFPTGGGRRGAAGINHLDDVELDRFTSEFHRFFCGQGEMAAESLR